MILLEVRLQHFMRDHHETLLPELPKKTLFRDLKNEFLNERALLLNAYLQ